MNLFIDSIRRGADEMGKADGERREQDVEPDVQAELRAGEEKGVFHGEFRRPDR